MQNKLQASREYQHPFRRTARGQAEIVWLLTGLFVGVLLLAVLFSFQRLTVIQRNGQTVLSGSLQAAVRDGACTTTSSTDAQEMDPTLAEAAFVRVLDSDAKAVPEGLPFAAGPLH